MELFQPGDPNQEEFEANIFYPTFVAKNIQDVLESREQIIENAIKMRMEAEAEARRAADEAESKLLKAITKRAVFAPNPVQNTSILGMFKSTLIHANAYVFLPNVHHDPKQDTSKRAGNLTLHDRSGHLDVNLPDLMYSPMMRMIGFRTVDPDVVKKEQWGSNVLLFADLTTRGQKQQDKYTMIETTNPHIQRRGGRMIPTILAQLKAAGIGSNQPNQ